MGGLSHGDFSIKPSMSSIFHFTVIHIIFVLCTWDNWYFVCVFYFLLFTAGFSYHIFTKLS